MSVRHISTSTEQVMLLCVLFVLPFVINASSTQVTVGVKKIAPMYMDPSPQYRDGGGYERAIVDFLCGNGLAKMNVTCKPERINLTPDERFDALANGTVDILITTNSYTAEREYNFAKEVEVPLKFIRPFYYSTGIGAFVNANDCLDESDPETCPDLSTLEATGKPWCAVKGSYWINETSFSDQLQKTANFTVKVVSNYDELVANVVNGTCSVAIGDAAFRFAGLVMVTDRLFQSRITDTIPYGILVRDGDKTLAAQVTAALLEIFNAKPGCPICESIIEDYENTHILSTSSVPISAKDELKVLARTVWNFTLPVEVPTSVPPPTIQITPAPQPYQQACPPVVCPSTPAVAPSADSKSSGMTAGPSMTFFLVVCAWLGALVLSV